MQAIKQIKTAPISPNKPSEIKARVISKKKTTKSANPYLGITIETTAKLLTNLVLSVCATSALLKLWPYYQSVQEKLEVINSEIQSTTERLSNEKADFSRYFDPSQTQTIMQEQSNRVDPSQIPIIWREDNGVKPSPESTSSDS
ncbi:MAG: hypothetical protein QNJ68_09660 [Microcoleaceae cyanobacterium MO_207.B10]|nr:hypothetical protein [Microcoleaceae cyanobacterium MO_207.B10]